MMYWANCSAILQSEPSGLKPNFKAKNCNTMQIVKHEYTD